MKCPECGKALPGGAKFCPECGSPSSASSQSGAEADVSIGGMRTMQPATSDPENSPPPDRSLNSLPTMGATSPEPGHPAPDAGTPLALRYELLEEIGRGGFAVVWKARDRKLDRIVAVKRLLAEALRGRAGEQTLARFRREAQAIAGLNHRNIVAVYDHDRDAEGDYIVMEYVAGGTLRQHLKERGGKLPVPEALALVRGIAQGLVCAHRRNLVHRDIKPGNILLCREGEETVPKIVDFGLARVGSDSELSLSGYGMGTPWYMPPEQRRDAKGVNHTADIYALGKVLYELVSGDVPDNVDPEKLPPALAKVVLRCIKSNPEERYFSCEELLAALEAVESSRSPAFASGFGVAGGGERGGGLSDNACPACGVANAPDVKFCESCGAGMTRLCPECERENSVHKQFCGGCGTDVEGFAAWKDALSRMEKAAGEKRWSRVVKEAGLLETGKVRLPGAKGQTLRAGIARLNEQAIEAQKTCESLRLEAHERLSAGDFAAAAGAVAHGMELDPHDSTLPPLAERLKQAASLKERAEEAVAVGDRPAAQVALTELAAIGGMEAGASIVAETVEQRLGDYETALAAAAAAADAHGFAEAVKAAETALGAAPRSVEAERLRRDCQEREQRLCELVQEAERLLHTDNAKVLTACRAALAIVPDHASAGELEQLARSAMETAASLRRQAREALEARRPDQAHLLWNQAEKLDAAGGNHVDGAQITAALERVSQSLAGAHEALKTRQVAKAERLARTALEVQRDCADAILADCARILARRKRNFILAMVAAALATGAAMVVVRKAEAVAEARAALKAEADRLAAEQRAREEQARQAKLAVALAAARQAKAAGQWQECLGQVSRVLALEGERPREPGSAPSPAFAEATALKTEAEQALKPKEPDPGDTQTVDLGGGVKLELVWCPAGTFTMGSPSSEAGRDSDETQHRVTLTKGFWMTKYEVTQAQWEAVMGINPSHFKNAGRSAPVEQVSWDDCQEFVRKVNARVPGGGFRLPTEAEWEYACRAGMTTAFHYGNFLDASMANFDGNYPYGNGRKGEYRQTTLPVGSFLPNAWGLYDMHGNVWEWCADWNGEYPSGSATDPLGPGSGSFRVLRGGSWSYYARGCRSAGRDGIVPGGSGDYLGLRLARNPQ